jgi:hypothetical protein
MQADSVLQAVQQSAVVVEQPDWGTLAVSGPDARAWLNGILTCDIKDLAPGTGARGLLLNKQGKIQSELTVVASEACVFVSTAPNTHAAVFSELQSFLIMEDAELDEGSQVLTWLTLHGPRAAELAASAAAAFDAHAGSVDFTGLGGSAIVVPRTHSGPLLARLRDESGVVVATPSVWTKLRVSYLVPQFGTDFGPQDNPHEASLDRRAVSFTKGCYLGQEAVYMQDIRGKVKRRIVSLEIAGADAVATGTPVFAAGERAGEITTSLDDGSPSVLALARLSTKALDANAALSVADRPASILRRP